MSALTIIPHPLALVAALAGILALAVARAQSRREKIRRHNAWVEENLERQLRADGWWVGRCRDREGRVVRLDLAREVVDGEPVAPELHVVTTPAMVEGNKPWTGYGSSGDFDRSRP